MSIWKRRDVSKLSDEELDQVIEEGREASRQVGLLEVVGWTLAVLILTPLTGGLFLLAALIAWMIHMAKK